MTENVYNFVLTEKVVRTYTFTDKALADAFLYFLQNLTDEVLTTIDYSIPDVITIVTEVIN